MSKFAHYSTFEMNLILSNELNEIISYSREEAMRMGSYTIGIDHLILGIIRHQDNAAFETLMNFGIDYRELKLKIEEQLKSGEVVPFDQADKLNLSKGAENSLKIMYLEARSLKEVKPGPVHLLLAILRSEEGVSMSILREYKITYERVKEMLKGKDTSRPAASASFDEEADSPAPENENDSRFKAVKNIRSQSDTPVLDSFGFDLTNAAHEGKLDPVVGRDKEIERLAQILGRRKKNNPVLIGEPGVGKSAIAEGLALRISQRKV